MLGEIPLEQKLIYLMEGPQGMAHPKEFFTQDPRMLIEPFCQSTGTFAGTSAAQFQKGAHNLVMSERLVKSVPHPVGTSAPH